MIKYKRIVKLLCLTLIFCIILVGCATTTDVDEHTEGQPIGETTENGQDQVRLSLGTASVGGNYYVIGSGLSQIWNQYSDYIQVTSEATGGSGANVGLVNDNQVQFGLTSDNTMYNGYNGLSWAAGEKYENIRTVAGLMPSALEICVPIEKNGINPIYDFED